MTGAPDLEYHRFLEAFRIIIGHAHAPGVTHENLKAVVASAVESGHRMASLAYMPVGFAIQGMQLQMAEDRALHKVAGTLDEDISAYYGRQAFLDELNDQLRRLGPVAKPPNYEYWISQNVNGLTQAADEARAAIESIYANVVISSWSIFEIAAADLWIAALDSHPATLAELKGKDKRRIERQSKARRTSGSRGSPLESGESARETEKQVRISDLHKVTKGTYDLTNSMGKLLQSKYSFDSLDGIREAYSVAFSSDSSQIDEVLADNDLDHASATRNVLVHNGGRADRPYIDKMDSLALPHVQLTERVALRSAEVLHMTNAFPLALRLATRVDEWVVRN